MKSNKASYNNHKRTGNTSGRSALRSSNRTRSYSIQNTMSDSSYNRTSVENRVNKEYGYYSGNYTKYNNSSVAQDYYYQDYYYDMNVEQKRRKRVKHAEEKEIVQLNMPRTIASIAVVFTLSLALLCAYAINSSYRGEISAKQAELAEIQEENQYLKTSLDDNVDLNKIAREAEKLGLQKPQAYQITEVQVPNESYTVQYDAKIATQDKSVWEFIKGLLKK